MEDINKNDMLAFIQLIFPQIKVDPFHREVAKLLDKIAKGEIKRLMIKNERCQKS